MSSARRTASGEEDLLFDNVREFRGGCLLRVHRRSENLPFTTINALKN